MIRKLKHRRRPSKGEVEHATLETAPPSMLNDNPVERYGSGDEEDDKDEEAAALAAELDETMSRAGSEWSNLAWWGDNKSEIDYREYDLRKVGRFTIARPKVLLERAKYSARENRAKASAFVDRRREKMGAARDDLKERREHALAVIRRAARERKRKVASGAGSVRGKVAAKVAGARDKAAGARDAVKVVVSSSARKERREQRQQEKHGKPAPNSPNGSPTVGPTLASLSVSSPPAKNPPPPAMPAVVETSEADLLLDADERGLDDEEEESEDWRVVPSESGLDDSGSAPSSMRSGTPSTVRSTAAPAPSVTSVGDLPAVEISDPAAAALLWSAPSGTSASSRPPPPAAPPQGAKAAQAAPASPSKAAVDDANAPASPATPASQPAGDDAADDSFKSQVGELNVLPPGRWGGVSEEAPPVRGASYCEDGKKVPAAAPLCELFAVQSFELTDEHIAGASARQLQTGALVPPPNAKFVLSIHFMCPRYSRGAPLTNVLAHASFDESPADVQGPEGELLRELWKGDPATAISRMKILAGLRSGPALVRHTMSWMGLDETRPMLICRQVHASVNRATLNHLGGGGGTFEHLEIAFDAAASPLCNQMFKYAWPSLPSVIVDITLMLEGRCAEHLPERPLIAFKIDSILHEEVKIQPADWPTDEKQIPGECLGSYRSDRGAKDLGSWQLTREVVSKSKPAKRGFFG